MSKRKGRVVLAGLSLAALVGLNPGASWAAIPADRARHIEASVLKSACDPTRVILARGGRGRGCGGGIGMHTHRTRWGGGDTPGTGSAYGTQDGSGSAPGPRDGTGYGPGKGAGSADCDGSGPKGKARRHRTKQSQLDSV